MTTSNNSPLKIYYKNIVGIFFLFLTQYKFKIFFSFYSLHSPATPQQHITSGSVHQLYIIYLFYFPKASIAQGLIYTTP